jgi:hypothetical protein
MLFDRSGARRLSRRVLVAFVTSVALVGTAWAGVGLAPVSDLAGEASAHLGAGADRPQAPGGAGLPDAAARREGGASGSAAEARRSDRSDRDTAELGAGGFLVGADRTSLAPDPDRWQTEGCSAYLSEFPAEVTHLAGRITEDMVLPGWPRSPDCIYLGGYGLGPSRPAVGVDPTTGYDVQSVAISNGDDLVIWQQTPFVGFFSTYREDLCDACGILDIRRAIAEDLDIELSDVVIASNHSHGGADGYGAWGGIPTWYREQVRDTLVESAARAVADVGPATIEVGQVAARPFSRERRSTYHSVSDYGAVWLQARARPERGRPEPGQVITTVVNFASHPTVLGAGNLLLHGDWPHTAGHELGEQLGGIGVVFEGGLGNVVPSRPRNADRDLTGDGEVGSLDHVLQMGHDFAATIAADIARGGHQLTSNEIASIDADVVHPVTNWTETALSLTNLLDREFFGADGGQLGGAHYGARSGTGQSRPCASASPVAIRTQQTAMRIGELTIVTAPGEIFSGISLIAKAKVRSQAFQGGETMVFGQAQDSLGYIIQSYEVHPPHGVSAGVGGIEYEETFMLDRCFGDHVLETMLHLGEAVWQER